MDGSKDGPSKREDLRKQAEERVRQKAKAIASQTDMDRKHLEHELRVYHLELELQNEDLRRAQEELEKSRAKYFDLFELAPVGYFTLGQKNLIVEANLAGAAILGVERSWLAGRRFTHFIARDTQDVFYLSWRASLDTRSRQTCELKMLRDDGSPVWVQMTIAATHDEEGNFIDLRIAITNISAHKEAEQRLAEYRDKLKGMAARILSVEDRERKRIALGLHDKVSQKLAIVKLAIESSLGAVSDPVALTSLRNAGAKAGEVMDDAESLTFELSDPVLREIGLVPALKKHLVEKIRNRHGIACVCRGEDEPDALDEETRMTLFRITRELTTNVVKHAKARNLTLSIAFDDGRMYVTVADDGIGFKQAADAHIHAPEQFGLFSIREQLDQMGGCLDIKSEPGKGTTATVILPAPDHSD